MGPSSGTGPPDAANAPVFTSGVPEWLRPLVEWMTRHWLGRVVIATIAGFRRLEIFDRAMVLGAQLFTSVVPILIMVSVWVGGSAGQRFADAMSMPPAAAEVLDQALGDSESAAFGIFGAAFVIVSATSLSRALTRALATVWGLPRPRTSLRSAWRWVAAVLVLALSVVVAKALGRYTDALPPMNTWTLLVTFVLDVAVTVFVPWVLLDGRIPVRRLMPGAVLFAVAMLATRPAVAAVLPRVLAESAERYGVIGVAFTYLACLYGLSLIFLTTAIVGRAVAHDDGRLGELIRADPGAAGSLVVASGQGHRNRARPRVQEQRSPDSPRSADQP
jgi:membrane protein